MRRRRRRLGTRTKLGPRQPRDPGGTCRRGSSTRGRSRRGTCPDHRRPSPTRAVRRGGCGTTMFVYKDDGCTARYTIRFRPGAPDAAVLRFDLAPDADLRLLDSSMPATVASAGMFDHVAIPVAGLAASERFYRTVLSVLGAQPSHADAELVEWEDWDIGATDREHPVTRGLHVGFRAPSREAVDAFWQAGVDEGYRDDGAPGPRTNYGPDYYGGFLLDPDGNSVEAVHGDRQDAVPAGRVDHLWIRVRDPQASRRFYTTIAPHAGLRLTHDEPERVQLSGPDYSFSLVRDERPLTEHVHLAFPAREDATVRAFHAAARAVYHPGYYGAFVLDPDGHNVEVVNHNRA